MKNILSPSAPSLSRHRLVIILAGLTLTAFTALQAAQIIDPDPEIFDGSKTKRDPVKQDPKTTVDNWEGPNLIIYDSDEKGEGKGGTGFVDGQAPGLDIGVAGGGLPGIPNPLAMGGGSGGGEPSANPLQIPAGQQSTPGTPKQSANTAGAAQSASRPSDVSIGDATQQIATTAQGQAGNEAGIPEGGEEGAKKKGQDGTQIPSAASMPQSGVRGGGIEKGDAMPPDM